MERKKNEYEPGRYTTYSRGFSRGPARVEEKKHRRDFHVRTMRPSGRWWYGGGVWVRVVVRGDGEGGGGRGRGAKL